MTFATGIQNIIFSTELTVPVAVMAVTGAALLVTYVLWQWCRTWRLERFVRHEEADRTYAEELPPVSIIVDACNETDQLNRFLPLVLGQDYPEFEVIAVVNGTAESTSGLLSEMKLEHPNLHITFAPYELRALSRKKLALMIGIKAAKYDIVLTTCANCRATSDQWLGTMMRNFTPDTDIVLGYSHYRYHRDTKRGRRHRVFDTVSTGVQWLQAAVKGRPYRGTSDNLAYRKRLFFEHQGFAKSMDLRWGEDDVFLSEIAQGAVTRVEMAPASQMHAYYEDLPRAHRVLKERREFTSRHVRRSPFVTQACMSFAWWLGHVVLVAAACMAWPNAAVAVAACVCLLLMWNFASWALWRQCGVLEAPRLWFSVPWLALWRPLVNARYRMAGSRNRKSNYTSYI
ncbi:MAG: glycosyltransferase [Muribaculaceae bacterium]|nr:glycosyltransferase [Muribaculaceae bacterium]